MGKWAIRSDHGKVQTEADMEPLILKVASVLWRYDGKYPTIRALQVLRSGPTMLPPSTPTSVLEAPPRISNR